MLDKSGVYDTIHVRMKKVVTIDPSAAEELNSFPIAVRARFNDLFEILSLEGKLEMPFAKKVTKNLFEIRVRTSGQWRATYAYFLETQIIILSAFQKKVQKTPKNELESALKRFKKY